MKLDITILGLGLMGRPIARGLIDAGYRVRGWNRSALARDLIGNIPLCRDLRDAADADICLLMLADSDAVDAVIAELEPHLAPGKLILDMGSSDPIRSELHARRLAAKEIGWVDAPVSGGPDGAATGTLTIMVGATEENFARVKPILEKLGSNVARVGDPGAGHKMKVINQLIVGITIEAVAEALTLAERIGIDPRLVQQVLKGGFADSKILQIHGARMIARKYTPGGKVKTQLKDLRMAKTLADATATRLPHLEETLEIYARLFAQGDGELDHSAPHKLL
ncbi:MAG: NAD(P)-dependent oxidoreductase [Chloroflexi bacterium]|nr:NAD(P)-dependent oxidoreductase [Chloroflexota bacterium]